MVGYVWGGGLYYSYLPPNPLPPPPKAKDLDPGFIVCRTGEDKNSMMCVFFPLCPCNGPEHMEKRSCFF